MTLTVSANTLENKKRRVAILEDDEDQSFVLCKWFGEDGFEPIPFYRGQTLLDFLKKETIDLAIIDWHLPDMQGVDVLREIRESLKLDIPIIFATSRSLEEDIVQGLSAGADDYLVKPLRHSEAIARAESVMRRVKGVNEEISRLKPSETFGAYSLAAAGRTVTFDGRKVELRDKEFQFATLLFANSLKDDKEISRRDIHEHIWTTIPFGISSRTIDTHAYRLRTKLELDGRHGYTLKAVRRQGYRLEIGAASSATDQDANSKITLDAEFGIEENPRDKSAAELAETSSGELSQRKRLF